MSSGVRKSTRDILYFTNLNKKVSVNVAPSYLSAYVCAMRCGMVCMYVCAMRCGMVCMYVCAMRCGILCMYMW